jgi:hypothetical protein
LPFTDSWLVVWRSFDAGLVLQSKEASGETSDAGNETSKMNKAAKGIATAKRRTDAGRIRIFDGDNTVVQELFLSVCRN